MSHASVLPDDVAAFLATEGRLFVESGRLIVVPAVSAGCVSPGHGPFEQLLAEVANAIPSVRCKELGGVLFGLMPYSPNASFEVLAELAEVEAERLRKLRLLLLKRSQELRPSGEIGLAAKALSLEIDDALRDLEDRNDAFARKKGFDSGKEPITGATASFRSGNKVSDTSPDSPFAPLLILQNLGYSWQVGRADVPSSSLRFEPQEDDVVGAWLAPPSAGWTIPTAIIQDVPEE